MDDQKDAIAVENLGGIIKKAHERIKKYVLHTPLIHSPYISMKTDCNVYLKMESEQITGSFKARGAFHKILSLGESNAEFVTASTGNHGMAFALACQTLQRKGTVFVPTNASTAKQDRMKLYGVAMQQYGSDCVDTEKRAREFAAKTGSTYISPYADVGVIAGQGTIGIELLGDLPNLDVVFVTVGGGGLISGIGAYLKTQGKFEVIGCLPANSPVMFESVKAGRIIEMESFDTLSDASAGGVEPGSPTFPLCQKVVDRWVTVSEQEISDAMYLMLCRHNKVVEGSAGVAVASFLKLQDEYKGKNVAILICGSNISMDTLKYVIKQH
uniref:L-serine ammonia-lyase n=1 Tax=Ciona savignyi TaxID=51511 RepID=H2YL93_CIOSA